MPTLTTRPPTRRARLRPVLVEAPQGFRLALPWLLASLAGTVVTLIGQVPGWMLLAFAGCALWRLVAERRRRALPSLPLRLAVFLPMAAGVVMTYGTHFDANSMLAFLVALLSLKVLELRSARDFTVVSLLGFFMTLSAFFYNQSFALSLYLGLTLFANLVALARCHGSGGPRSLGPTVRLGLVMVVQALPVVVVLFIIFPRVQGSFLLRLSNPNVGLMGMSDHLEPGAIGSLVQSEEIAFRAQLDGGRTLQQNQLYWRAIVLEICESSMAWRAAEQVPAPPHQTLPGTPASRIEQRITVMPHGERWLFSLDHPVELKTNADFHGQLITSDVLRSQSPIYSKTIYTAVSDLEPDPAQHLDARHREFYTRVPADASAQAVALARGWRGAGNSDEQTVRLGLQYLRDGGFSYSLNPGPLPAGGALDYFLFRSRKGFCEHYAAAFCTLLRAAGVPTRIVVGYQGGEFNTWGKYYTVRQSDAHAWVEVWLEGHGWQREDPTAMVAPDRVSYGAENYAVLASDGANGESRLERLRRLNAPGVLRWLGHNTLLAWDSLDQQWNLLVLGFDQEQQMNVLQHFGLGDLDLIGGTLLSVAVMFALLGTVMVGARALDRAGRKNDDPVRRLYARFCRRLAKAAGVARTDTEGPLDYARRASEALPHHAPEIRRITDLYVASRYAPPTDGDGALAGLREAVRSFHPNARAAG